MSLEGEEILIVSCSNPASDNHHHSNPASDNHHHSNPANDNHHHSNGTSLLVGPPTYGTTGNSQWSAFHYRRWWWWSEVSFRIHLLEWNTFLRELGYEYLEKRGIGYGIHLVLACSSSLGKGREGLLLPGRLPKFHRPRWTRLIPIDPD